MVGKNIFSHTLETSIIVEKTLALEYRCHERCGKLRKELSNNVFMNVFEWKTLQPVVLSIF